MNVVQRGRRRAARFFKDCIQIFRIWFVRHRVIATGGSAVLLIAVVACESTNTYPIDIFTGMHYQKSYKTYEPPRLGEPPGIVPIQGRAPIYTDRSEMLELENSVAANEETLAVGQRTFEINCQVCHGPQAMGNGPVSGFFNVAGANPPADLTADRLQQATDGYIYSVVLLGFGEYMPSFGNLIPGDDIWAIVNYIRTLQSQ